MKNNSTISNVMAIFIALLWMQSAAAHQLSTAYLKIEIDQQSQLHGQWQLRWFDLDLAVGLDKNLDGQLLWQEVISRKQALRDYLTSTLSIQQGGDECHVEIEQGLQTEQHFDEAYLLAGFTASCRGAGELTVTYQAIFSQDSDHKALLNISGAQTFGAVLDVQKPSVSFRLDENKVFATFLTYTYQGMLHIWKGSDHILFLLTLLLPCVLYRQGNRWLAKTSTSEILGNTAWIVSAFTLAHSLTLTATAMDWMSGSSRWVEFAIAISVLLAALNNIWPLVLRLGWLTFAFGLLHGMGFAGVLGELGLAQGQKLLSVLAFNLGVEFGQLALLLTIMPLLLLVKNKYWYQHYAMKLASAVIAIVAINWSWQRF